MLWLFPNQVVGGRESLLNKGNFFTLAERCSGFGHLELVQFVYQVRVATPRHNGSAMDESDQEVDPDVPWNHGSDDDSSENLDWPDFELWRPRWVGMSPSAIAHQIEQEAFQRTDRKVLHRIRHNKALKVRCSNQFHLDKLIEKIRITGGNDAMQPEAEIASSDDDFW